MNVWWWIRFWRRFWWMLPIIGHIAGFLLISYRARKRKFDTTDEEKHFHKVVFRGTIIQSLPWVIMLIAGISRGASSLDFIRPFLWNPWVIATYAIIYSSLIYCFIWVFFLGGADFLIQYYSLLTGGDEDPPLDRTSRVGIRILMAALLMIPAALFAALLFNVFNVPH
ncbi:hypothetical protein KAI78_01380 [bacterium]|nr:hypothetical protein [bacterium]